MRIHAIWPSNYDYIKPQGRYLKLTLVPFIIEEYFDVLTWWKVNGDNYDILSPIARDILVIPATTVSSGSAFSTGGQFVSPY